MYDCIPKWAGAEDHSGPCSLKPPRLISSSDATRVPASSWERHLEGVYERCWAFASSSNFDLLIMLCLVHSVNKRALVVHCGSGVFSDLEPTRYSSREKVYRLFAGSPW